MENGNSYEGFLGLMTTSELEFSKTTKRMLATMMSCIEWYYYKQSINEAAVTLVF